MACVSVLNGDCLDLLKTLPDASINCCVTSPPYYGLRDYGTAEWQGGDTNCNHIETPNEHSGELKDKNQEGYKEQCRHVCNKCGAIHIDSQIGVEDTPEEYVNKMVLVFREVRRVLKDDGTLWLNLGDSYCGTSSKGDYVDPKYSNGRTGQRISLTQKIKGIKSKDLIGIPWRVAFALQADGWYLRQDIIWHKPNPIPESVKDRCTKSHEYIFLLSKSKSYWFDCDAIKEPAIYAGDNRGARRDSRRGTRCNSMNGKTGLYRNKRSVWTVTTKPYKGAHFATFPPDLIQPCIVAGCPKDGVVLDPFGGSGTTGLVACDNGRNAILIELNSDYVNLIRERCGLFYKKGLELSHD